MKLQNKGMFGGGIFAGLIGGASLALLLYALAFLLEFLNCLTCGLFPSVCGEGCFSCYLSNNRENLISTCNSDLVVGLFPIWNSSYFVKTLIFCTLAGAVVGAIYGIAKQIQKHGGQMTASEWVKTQGETVNGPSLMFAAMSQARVDVMDLLVANGLAIDWKDADGKTFMHIAAMNGFIEAMKWIHKKDKNTINMRDSNDLSPMDVATAGDQIESIKCLKKMGVNVNTGNNQGLTPLFLAAIGGKVKSIKCLKDLGANVDVRNNGGMTPISIAAAAGQIESIECLAELGADLKIADNHGMAPMCSAVIYGQIESIVTLNKLGVDVNEPLIKGRTPIFAAAMAGQIASMECLKALGAKLDVRDNNGQTPADLVIMEGQTPADIAIVKSQTEAVEWLRANGKL